MLPAFERQWVLEHPGVSFAWGGQDPANPFRLPRGIYNLAPPEQAATDVATEDTTKPRQDGVRFGQDFRGGRTWTFTLGVKAATPAAARALLASAELAWRGEGVRLTPGAMASLTTMVGGQYRTMYGRPRLFTPNLTNIGQGEASAVCTFDCFNDLWYGPQQQVRVNLQPSATSGGFTVPMTVPLVIAASASAAGGLIIGGNLPTYLAAEIHGPIGQPVLFSPTAGWQVRLNVGLGTGAVVTLDARPWEQSITTGEGGSLAGKLDRGGYLSDLKLAPGSHEVGLKGVDVTGAAYVMLRWQSAHSSMI